MSSNFSGGPPDFFSGNGRSISIPTNMNNPYNNSNNNSLNSLSQNQFSFRSPLAGILSDPVTQIRRPDLIGKRSLAEFQQQQSFYQHQQQGLGFYLRNVKQRPNYQQNYASSQDFSISPENSSVSNSSVNLRYGRLPIPILQQHRPQPLSVVNNLSSLPNLSQNNRGYVNTVTKEESEKRMMKNQLQELEKQLLEDEEDEGEGGEAISVVTNSEWSETIQNLINPTSEKPILPSPTSSSSSCSSTSASPCPKESLIDAAVAISEGKSEVALEILTRVQQLANVRGNSEQRLAFYMISALKSRINPPPAVNCKEQSVPTQMLYDVSPCFKLGFMAANLGIIEAATELGLEKIHVVDFEIGQGGQYLHLLHAIAAKSKGNCSLKITTFADFNGDEKLRLVGQGLKAQANKIGVQLSFSVKNLSCTTELSRENLCVQPDEALAVNFAFKLYKLPDESVTTENLRDELLRRVKSLSPVVMTVVEQEMNANTSPLVARVRDACEYYGALFESLDATLARDRPERVEIEEGLSRKMRNSVACEGRDRVERCEVFGKWRARMSMAGFKPNPMGQHVAESLRSKLNSGTRGNPGFTVSEQSGGVCFGWMGRTLTVASAWR